jgi:hypothetical protein
MVSLFFLIGVKKEKFSVTHMPEMDQIPGVILVIRIRDIRRIIPGPGNYVVFSGIRNLTEKTLHISR